ncbi:hypothetical protein G6F24_015792 [Rhizopus arrhizus]|nr:hypothetical protein G6F24_015792 [Rhizopus arrhizus]
MAEARDGITAFAERQQLVPNASTVASWHSEQVGAVAAHRAPAVSRSPAGPMPKRRRGWMRCASAKYSTAAAAASAGWPPAAPSAWPSIRSTKARPSSCWRCSTWP